MKDATAVITATNRGALYEALAEMERGRTVGVSAKVRTNLRQIVETVGWLRDGKDRPDDYLIHPDMKKFLYKTVRQACDALPEGCVERIRGGGDR